MTPTPVLNPITLPITVDAGGEFRVSGTRVTLDTILIAYRSGELPESIHEGFPGVPLADIHTLVGYYLNNRASLDAWLDEIQRRAEAMRREIEAATPPRSRAEIQRRFDEHRQQK